MCAEVPFIRTYTMEIHESYRGRIIRQIVPLESPGFDLPWLPSGFENLHVWAG